MFAFVNSVARSSPINKSLGLTRIKSADWDFWVKELQVFKALGGWCPHVLGPVIKHSEVPLVVQESRDPPMV